jgi:hypothetical protein
LEARSSSPFFITTLVVALAGCGGVDASSRLEIEHDDAGDTTRVTGDWTYRSAEVDVDLTVTTDYSGTGCVTTARLWVNEAAASPETHRLRATACPMLALTEQGDIVLHDSPTGHDWSTEELRVDTERKHIELGPWTASTADAVTYRFTLSSSPCGTSCDCPTLRRRAGGMESVLELGRRCN